MKDLVIMWANCEIKKMDIWDIDVEAYEYGCIKEYKTVGNKRVPVKKDTNRLNYHMVSYFSVGIDA